MTGKDRIVKPYNVRESKKIPYSVYDKSINTTLREGAGSRGNSLICYTFTRLKNYVLLLLSMIAPFNSWRVKLNKWKGVNIGRNVYLGMFVYFDNAYPEYIYIEDKAAVNAGSMIITHFNPYIHFREVVQASVQPVVIKEGAFVAVRAILLPGITVGEYSMVTAGSVVSKDVEPYSLVRGNPAVKVADLKRRLAHNRERKQE